MKPGRSPRPARPATLRSRTLMHGRWRAARRQPREPGRVRWIWEIYEETNGFSRGNHGKPWETGGFPKHIKESDEVFQKISLDQPLALTRHDKTEDFGGQCDDVSVGRENLLVSLGKCRPHQLSSRGSPRRRQLPQWPL